MNNYIGIDGGGTKTRLTLFNHELAVLEDKTLPPFHFLCMANNNILKNVFSEIEELQKRYNIEAIGMGIAGIDSEKERLKLFNLVNDYFEDQKVIVVNDAIASLAGALLGAEGILINAGTGSIAYGKDREGKLFRSGGWDYLLGDEGSGYWIAIQYIKNALYYFDGGEEDKSIELVKEHFQLANLNDLISYIYGAKFNKERVAALAAEIALLAQNGDLLALDIYKEAGKELAKLAELVYKHGNFSDPVKLTYSGSIFKSFELFSDSFSTYLDKREIAYEWHIPERSPEAGAALLAKEITGKVKY